MIATQRINSGTATNYPNFLPEPYKVLAPDYSGITTSLGGFNNQGTYKAGGTINFYGQFTDSNENFVLNHRGYIYAQQTGTYTFSTTNVDDIVIVWVGALAYSGWTRANAQLVQAYAAKGTAGSSYSTQLVAGQYYPLRIIFGNAQEVTAFQITVTAPDGTVFLGPSSGASPYLVQYSCDKTAAPPFPAFGSET